MSFLPGNTGSPSQFPDGFIGSQLSNVETLTATKTLTSADRRQQILTPSGATRTVILPNPTLIGENWVILNAATDQALNIQTSNGSSLMLLQAGESVSLFAKSATPAAPTDWTVQSGSSGGGLNEQPLKNYLKTYSSAVAAPGTVSLLASTTANLVSLTSFYANTASGASALTSSSSTALRGSTNYLTATSASNATGATFVQFPAFALEGSDLGKPISISFDVTGVTTDGNWDVVVVRYNSSGTYQSLISVAGNASGATPPSAKLPTGTTVFNGFFVPDSTTAGDLYAVRLRSLANTVQIRVDNLFVGQQPIRTGGSVTDWQSYTPTGPYTTNTTYTGKWRRIGDSIELMIDLSFSGAPNASLASFPYTGLLNGLGLTVDNSKFPITTDSVIPVGQWSILDSGIQIWNGGIQIEGTTGVNLYNAAGGAVSAAGPLALNTGDNLGMRLTLPITGWSSNVTMADRAVEEYASNSSTTDADDTSSFAYGIAGSQFAAMTAVRNKRVRFTTPIQPTDALVLEYTEDSGVTWAPIGVNNADTIHNFMRQTTIAYGAHIVFVNSTEISVRFGNYRRVSTGTYGAAGLNWSDIAGSNTYRWRVRKVSGGAQVGFPINSSQIVGRQDGLPPATGMVGEMLGTSRAGTGGKTYSTRTTAAATTGSMISLVSISLNKGIYLVSATIEQGVTSGSTFLSAEGRIGSTAVTNSVSTAISSSAYGTLSFTFPVEISADSTAVAIWGQIGVGTAAGSDNEMWAVRIA